MMPGVVLTLQASHTPKHAKPRVTHRGRAALLTLGYDRCALSGLAVRLLPQLAVRIALPL